MNKVEHIYFSKYKCSVLHYVFKRHNEMYSCNHQNNKLGESTQPFVEFVSLESLEFGVYLNVHIHKL